MPEQPKDRIQRPVLGTNRVHDKKATSPESSDMIDVDSSQSTSSSFITPVANMTLRSDVPTRVKAEDSNLTCEVSPSPIDIQLPRVQPVTCSEGVVSAMGTPHAPVHDVDLQYQGDVESSSGLTSRSLSQASHSKTLLPLIPGQRVLEASTGQARNIYASQVDAGFAKEEGMLPRSNHGLPSQAAQMQMYLQAHQGQGNENRCIASESHLPVHTQAQEEIRTARTRPSYSSSGLEGVLPSTTIAGNGYDYFGPSQHSNPALQPVPASSHVPMTTGYPSYGASEYDGAVPVDRDWLLDETWYPTLYDTKPTSSMLAQGYNMNCSSNAALPSQRTASMSMATNEHGQTLTAQEWQAMSISARNGYTRGFVQDQQGH